MYKRLAITALALATTMAFGQATKSNADDYKVNQSGSQKITNGPVIEYTSDHSAMVAWSTKYPGGTYIAYGTDQNNLSQRTEKAWGGTNHRLEIKNLQPSTTYFFQVRSEDAKGSGAMGADVQSNVEQFKTVAKGAAPDKANYNVGVNNGNVTTDGAPSGMPSTGASGQYMPLYRMFGNGDHFYTTNPSERTSAESSNGYKDEGITGYLATSQVSGSQPFYRMIKNSTNFNDHFYTANPSERQSATTQGYRDEGVIGFIATTQLPGTVPLYRLFGPNGDHMYTTNSSERQSAAAQGYKDEGVVAYIWSQPQQ
jgi:hypothetical protein